MPPAAFEDLHVLLSEASVGRQGSQSRGRAKCTASSPRLPPAASLTLAHALETADSSEPLTDSNVELSAMTSTGPLASQMSVTVGARRRLSSVVDTVCCLGMPPPSRLWAGGMVIRCSCLSVVSHLPRLLLVTHGHGNRTMCDSCT